MIQVNAFVCKRVYDLFAHSFRVVFVCNCLFLNNLGTCIEFFVVYVSFLCVCV